MSQSKASKNNKMEGKATTKTPCKKKSSSADTKDEELSPAFDSLAISTPSTNSPDTNVTPPGSTSSASWHCSLYDPGLVMREMEWRILNEEEKSKREKQRDDATKLAEDIESKYRSLRAALWPEDSVLVRQKLIVQEYEKERQVFGPVSTVPRKKAVVNFLLAEEVDETNSDPAPSPVSHDSETFGQCSKTKIRFWAINGHRWRHEQPKAILTLQNNLNEDLFEIFIKEIHQEWNKFKKASKAEGSSRKAGTFPCSSERLACCDKTLRESSFLGFPIKHEFNCNSACLVYAAECQTSSCKSIYIGETQRRFADRINEHVRSSSKTAVGDHLKTYKDHVVKFTGLVYASPIDSERQALEKAFIQYFAHRGRTLYKGKLLNNQQIGKAGECTRDGCTVCESWEKP